MAITRVKFTSIDTDFINFTCVINPSDIQYKLEQENNIIEAIDGESTFQTPVYDSRVRQLIWDTLPVHSKYPNFATMVSNLESALKKRAYIDDGTYGDTLDSEYASGSQAIRIINIIKSPAKGGLIIFKPFIVEFVNIVYP